MTMRSLSLVNHVERDVLALRPGRYRRGHGDVIGLAPFDPVVGVSYRRAVAGDAAFAQQLLDAGPGEAVQCLGQETVEAMPGMGPVRRHPIV